MAQRGTRWWAARTVVLLMTLLGLLGMHGLPDGMASSNGPPMATPASMPTPLAEPAMPMVNGSAAARRARYSDRRTDHQATVLRADAQFADPSLAPPTGCGMDHANCVAVLRDAVHLSAPSAAPAPPHAASALPGPSLAPIPASGPRAPPNVSLIDLGISRT